MTIEPETMSGAWRRALGYGLFVLLAVVLWSPISDRVHGRPADTTNIPPHRLDAPPIANAAPPPGSFGSAPVMARLPQPDSAGRTIALRWDRLDAFRIQHPDAEFRLPPGDGRVETGADSGYRWSVRQQADGILVEARQWQETASFASRYLVRQNEIRLLHHDRTDAMATLVAAIATAFAAGVGARITRPILIALWQRRRK